MLLRHHTWTSELSTHILHEFFSTEKKGTEILYEKPISLVFFFSLLMSACLVVFQNYFKLIFQTFVNLLSFFCKGPVIIYRLGGGGRSIFVVTSEHLPDSPVG